MRAAATPPSVSAEPIAPATPSRSYPDQPILSGWGRLAMPGRELVGEHFEALSSGAVLSRGLGRSYGDSSLPARPSDKVVNSVLADRVLAFDEQTGILRAEAGMSLAQMNRLFMPRGFFTPVTPGTKFVTLGGMVASDVHGKNHHCEGCFGAHVRSLRMRLADDSIITCRPDHYADLFWATTGGMGLTGHILEVEVQLKRIDSSWLVVETERVPDIDAFLAALGRAAPRWPMTVGWIDCVKRGRHMGRGILTSGRWATREEAGTRPPREARPITLPFVLPDFLVNRLTVKAFNALYYRRKLSAHATQILGPDPFFYPLDGILHWNRGYGSRGFTQYQCVLPRAAGSFAVREFMELLTRLGGASPVTVIKDCGPEGKGILSFPLEGMSIAIDLAVRDDTQRIVDSLNEFVIAAGGRIYLTKDRFTRPEHFRAMEPRLDRFLAIREKYDPHRRLRSAQSVRLLGDRV
jgi:FAD/FMN-containing dehydrogenase